MSDQKRESVTNIFAAPLRHEVLPRGERWRYVDLSGEHLGVRIEAMAPGESSSEHHYHSMEEEHVLIMEGAATLVLGEAETALKPGDHVWFPAGREVPHHIENRSDADVKYLVFGERCAGDVVFYPKHQVMTVKGLGWKRLTYRPVATPDAAKS